MPRLGTKSQTYFSLARPADTTLTELQAGEVIFNNYGQVKHQARDQHIAGNLIIN
jgi:hypothetical protein